MLKASTMIAIYVWEEKHPISPNSYLTKQLLGQMGPDLNPLHKSSLFMIPTQGTNHIDDLIHLLQGLAVHALVKFLEVGFDLLVLEAAILVVGIVQHLQDALGIVGVVWLQGIQL